MKHKKILIFLIIFLLLNALIFLSGKSYIYKALFYNFANIDDYEIFDNRKVEASNSYKWALSDNYNRALPKPLNKTLEELHTIAFIIIKDGFIEQEHYWEGYTEDSYSNSFSMAKTIVSILTGIALKDGDIESLDQKVADFLPEFKKGGLNKVTIKHLLTMTSGLNWEENYASPISHTTEAYYGNDLRDLIGRLKVEVEPGTTFRYKSGDTQILSFVLSAATGMTLSELASERLWKPIGAEKDALWSLDHKNGAEKAYCCFNSNAKDFARIGKLYLNKGYWGKESIVDSSYVEASTKELHLKNDIIDYYGYSWWLLPEGRYYARGILGQYVIVIPDKNIIVVKLGKDRGDKVGHHYQDVFDIVDYVLQTF